PNPGHINHYLYGISAISANDVWAVGNMDGLTYSLHWDGTKWSVVPTPQIGDKTNDLFAVKGLSANNVWAVGRYFTDVDDETLILHWDGHAWRQVPSPSPLRMLDNFLFRLGATSPTDVWTVGETDRGVVWQPLVE